MSRETDNLAEEWLKRMRDDELSARALLKDRGGAPNTVCFLSQQAAEKALKAFLAMHSQAVPKMHNIGHLLELSMRMNPSFSELDKPAALLDTYYIETRYPGNAQDFTWEEAEEAFQSAQEIMKMVLQFFTAES